MESNVGPGAGRLHGLHAHAELRLRLLREPLLETVATSIVGREGLGELGVHRAGVEIAHDREDHLVWNVAILIEGAEGRQGRVLDHVTEPDRVPLVGVVAEHEPLDLVVDLVVGPVLPLLVLRHHHFPLLVHLLLRQLEVHPGIHGAVQSFVEVFLGGGESVAGVVVGGVAAALLADPLHLLPELQLALLEGASTEDQVLVVVAEAGEGRRLRAASAVHRNAHGDERLRVVLDENQAKSVRQGLAADGFRSRGETGREERRRGRETEKCCCEDRTRTHHYFLAFWSAPMISSGSGYRPAAFLEKMTLPSAETSKTPPPPGISLESTPRSFFSSAAKLVALGK